MNILALLSEKWSILHVIVTFIADIGYCSIDLYVSNYTYKYLQPNNMYIGEDNFYSSRYEARISQMCIRYNINTT